MVIILVMAVVLVSFRVILQGPDQLHVQCNGHGQGPGYGQMSYSATKMLNLKSILYWDSDIKYTLRCKINA